MVMAFAYAINYLLYKKVVYGGFTALTRSQRIKQDSLPDHAKPASFAEHGTPLPYLVGRRRVGAVVLWVGDRKVKKQVVQSGSSGGKGTGGVSTPTQTVKVYFESAWHGLCLGPAYALYSIRRNGKVLWRGPITKDSHPSGSTISLGNFGSFTIYWGELTQGTNSFLSNSNRVSILSRWPYACYIVWKEFRLGSQPVWPSLEYELETKAPLTVLSGSSDYSAGTFTLTSTTNNVVTVISGSPGTAQINIAGKHTKKYAPGTWFQLAGNHATTNGNYCVLSVSYNQGSNRTRIKTVQSIAGTATNNGTIQPYLPVHDSGVNHVHALSQFLFAAWPHGLELTQSDWNLNTFEDAADLMIAENVFCNMIGGQGEDIQSMIGRILADIGAVFTWNPLDGKWWIYPIREVTGAYPSLPEDIIQEPLPEISNGESDSPADKVIFSFIDIAQRFRLNTVPVDEDSAAITRKRQNAREVQLTTITNLPAAVFVAARREQEELSRPGVYAVYANREARLLFPGQLMDVPNVEERLRLLVKEVDVNSGRVVLRASKDLYGIEIADIPQNPGKIDESEDIPEEDFVLSTVDLPPEVQGIVAPNGVGGVYHGVPGLAVARIRGNLQVEGVVVWISSDDTTFTRAGEIRFSATGGVLDDAVTNTQPFNIEEGPEFTILGDEIGNVVDYSGDEASWRLGRQVCLINDEIFFLRNITLIDADTGRLDGLLRARYGTTRGSHLVGDSVYIAAADDIEFFQDPSIFPGQTLYLKFQPFGDGTIDLADITSVAYVVPGRGLKPDPVCNLETANFLNTFDAGESAFLEWSFRRPGCKSGAGSQPAGSPVVSSFDALTFVIRFYTVANVLKREVIVNAPEYEYTYSDRNTDFGSDPTAMKVRVSMIGCGFESEYTEITITKV